MTGLEHAMRRELLMAGLAVGDATTAARVCAEVVWTHDEDEVRCQVAAGRIRAYGSGRRKGVPVVHTGRNAEHCHGCEVEGTQRLEYPFMCPREPGEVARRIRAYGMDGGGCE